MSTTATLQTGGDMESVLTKNQRKAYQKTFTENGCEYLIVAKLRYDDECNNGHNTFAITGEIWKARNGVKVGRDMESGGCIHEDIAKHFPELAPLIKWHLCSSDGPMHYIGNTVYLAGERDCWGMLKGEFRQHTSRGQQNNGVEGVPNWVLDLPDRQSRDVYATEKPTPVTVEWKAYGRTGEGKGRELDKARSAAVWPDATDEDLTAPGLEERLKARLPRLLEEFKAAVESLGFVF